MAIAKLETTVIVETVDYHGHPKSIGGDPIGVELTLADAQSNNQLIETQVEDLDNGTYEIRFRPPNSARYALRLSVFERPIKDYPLFFNVTKHNEPVKVYGQRGHAIDEFHQPVAVTVDDNCTIYIVDTGNSRIKAKFYYITSIFNFFFDNKIMFLTLKYLKIQVLDCNLEFQRHIINEGLEGQSCTGIAVSEIGLVIVNWRTRTVTEMNTLGDTIRTFSHNAFQVSYLHK